MAAEDDLTDDWGAALAEQGATAEAGAEDGLADDWGAALAEQGAPAAEWGDWSSLMQEAPAGNKGGADRILNQDEIDGLLGFSIDHLINGSQSGIRAIIDSAMVSYERLPMLEILFDRFVRLLTISLRNFTSDNVEVSIDTMSSVRFGDYLNSIPLPAIITVFKAEQWDNFGLVTVDSSLIYSIIDVLLGGRGSPAVRVEGRPYTTIEVGLVKRMIELVLADGEVAFGPVSPVKFTLDRMETNPRFAQVSRPANAAILVRLRIDMEDRGGTMEMLLPYATIEPIREHLLQSFTGEKFGRDSVWESHLATEIFHAATDIDAVLYESELPLRSILDLKVGDTLPIELRPEDLVTLRCGGVEISKGRMGRVGDQVSIRLARPLKPSRTTMTVFDIKDVSAG